MAIRELSDRPVLPPIGALSKSLAHFARPSGPDILARTENFLRWQDGRRYADAWPYSRSLVGPPTSRTTVQTELGKTTEGINFASQDYLSLSTHPAIIEAAMEALKEFGPH